MKRVLAEFLLIVSGVTVALGAESWWSGREARVREQVYIAQLREDAAQTSRRLAAAIAQEEMQLGAKTAIRDALLLGHPIPVDSAQAWLVDRRGSMYYSDPRVLDGTLVALVESGDLGIVRDNALRLSAVGYLTQLQRDLAEFDRFVGLEMEEWRIMLGAAALTLEPGDVGADEVLLGLQRATGDDEVRMAFTRAAQANAVRLTYLRRMLVANNDFRMVLDNSTR